MEELEALNAYGCSVYDPMKSHAYTRTNIKTAAIFFDKLYVDQFDFVAYRELFEQCPLDLIYFNQRITGGIARYMDMDSRGRVSDVRDAFTRGVLEVAKRESVDLVPLYDAIPVSADNTDVSQLETVELLLSAFPLIRENNLVWEQVQEFRSDLNSIGGARKMRTLLEEISKCKSTVEAADTVTSMIVDYESACKKHGVDLVSSVFTQVYDKNTLLASAGVGILSGNIEAGLGAGAIKLATDMSMSVYSSHKNRSDLAEAKSSGAVAIELQRLSDDVRKTLP